MVIKYRYDKLRWVARAGLPTRPRDFFGTPLGLRADFGRWCGAVQVLGQLHGVQARDLAGGEVERGDGAFLSSRVRVADD